MDLTAMMAGTNGPWTEERHSSFLNWVEASFVRRVLGGRCACSGHSNAGWRPPPLDRFIPDSATESTRDLGRLGRAPRRSSVQDEAARSHDAGRSRRWTEAAAADDDTEAESDVTSRDRARKRQLLGFHGNTTEQYDYQVGRGKPDGLTNFTQE